MKHTLKITLFLVFMFLIAQIIGLVIVKQYITVKDVVEINQETGEEMVYANISYSGLPLGIERPPIGETTSFMYVLAAILIGTVLFFFIVKWKKRVLWKVWFYLAVMLCLTIALAPFISPMTAWISALILAYFKVFRPQMILHNATELLIYGGLAAIFVPVMNLLSVIILLVLISIYDMFAVWYSKHMIKLAKFQTESKVFAGLLIPYKKVQMGKKCKGGKKAKVNIAILGGGDIGFPLIFAGVVMKGMLLQNPALGFFKTLLIPVAASIALLLLFLNSRKGRFYPAMPFLTVGCLVGWVLTLI